MGLYEDYMKAKPLPNDELINSPVWPKDVADAVLGNKKDASKPRWSLLPTGAVERIIAVLEFGAAKYSVDNWQHVPDARKRYYDATMRHIEAWWRGEKNDPESGLPHLAHATACLLFLMWFDDRSEEQAQPVVTGYPAVDSLIREIEQASHPAQNDIERLRSRGWGTPNSAQCEQGWMGR